MLSSSCTLVRDETLNLTKSTHSSAKIGHLVSKSRDSKWQTLTKSGRYTEEVTAASFLRKEPEYTIEHKHEIQNAQQPRAILFRSKLSYSYQAKSLVDP